ncbi:hypothetical protein ABG79_00450 [Caloramator mitchellensis]|uniref:Uncharacterized protein n=1 Tax=Caloramator mitchellensis TaxID=908809 RepID=A0A0R3JVU6_CALMK|nr:hypothetical protein [Caloramator mitchellensis]KRQ87649.1 hypothetical protein ABG79_00450 [Caloramator mitchellensis]
MNNYMPMCPYANQMMPNMPMMPMQHMMPMHYITPMHQMIPMVPMLMEMDDEDDDDDRSPERITVEEILEKIEKNEPQVFAIMRSFGMPMPIARRLVRRIIRLTLRYSR